MYAIWLLVGYAGACGATVAHAVILGTPSWIRAFSYGMG